MRKKISIALLVTLACVALVWAQVGATLEGVVTDPTGAAIPDVKVTATNEGNGQVRTTTTGSDGRFSFNSMPPGLWTVEASSDGFKVFRQNGVSLTTGGTVSLQITLEIGSVSETVEGASRQKLPRFDMTSPPAPPPPPPAPAMRAPPQSLAESLSGGGMRGARRGIFGSQSWFEATESYGRVEENRFQSPLQTPLSTFSIDVDTASYSNVRRFLHDGRLPPPDAVRVEELINYFRYDDPAPAGEHPFSVSAEVARCPWNQDNKLVRIGLRSQPVDVKDLPPANLVFLLDVSGSMASPDKLPLLKKSFALMVEQLRPEDRVAIAVYAGAAGLVLPPTPGSEKDKILGALERLRAGGSTAGAAGIQLAYKTAEEGFRSESNNRVILATDGDFNVGVSSESELIRLIESKRDQGIFLTVLGFGTGNIQDNKMEQLADHGNGNYGYIDSMLEARRQLVGQLGATLLTVAKDVKIQVEFNPKRVKQYRLVGYENRLLAAEDFDDDTKDAGEMGAGHVVTALYEIVPGEAADPKLRYQARQSGSGAPKSELLFVKVRYKAPDEDESKLLVEALADRDRPIDEASANLRFAAAVAQFGMLLRDSEHKGDATFDAAASLADAARGDDADGRRTELVFLAKTAASLSTVQASAR